MWNNLHNITLITNYKLCEKNNIEETRIRFVESFLNICMKLKHWIIGIQSKYNERRKKKRLQWNESTQRSVSVEDCFAHTYSHTKWTPRRIGLFVSFLGETKLTLHFGIMLDEQSFQFKLTVNHKTRLNETFMLPFHILPILFFFFFFFLCLSYEFSKWFLHFARSTFIWLKESYLGLLFCLPHFWH